MTINAALNGLSYQGNENYNGSDTLSIDINDLGQTGAGGVLSDSQTIDISIDPVNDAPVISKPVAQSVDEEAVLIFSTANNNAISVSDVEATNTEVSLSVSHGQLTLAQTTGLTISAGANGTLAMTFSGSLEDVNAALDGLSYQGDEDYDQTDSLVVVVNDQEQSGSGGILSDSQSIDITLNPINDAPVIIKASMSVNIGQTVTVDSSMIDITDIDSDAIDVDIKLSNVQSGQFELVSNPSVAVTEFTQQQLLDGEVVFVHDGSNNAPSYSIAVGDQEIDVNTVTAIAANNITFDGKTAIDADNNGQIDAWAPANSNGIDNANGSTFTITTNSSSELTLVYGDIALISDDGTHVVVDMESDGVNDVTAPSGSVIVDNDNGSITTTTPSATIVTSHDNTNTIINDNGTTTTITDNNGTNLSVPSGSVLTDNGNGSFNIDVDNDGTVDAIIPQSATVVNNGNGTLTTTTAGGAEVITQANAGTVITDNGSVLTVNGDGQGVADITSVPNNTDVSIAANGDVTATTSNNSVLNLTADSEAVITDNGSVVTLTDNNGTNLSVPSGSVLTDNGNGSFNIDVDNDGTVDAIIPQSATVVNNGNGTLTTTTAGGAEVITQANAGTVITDNGSILTVNGDGQGVADISSVANDTDVSIAANGDVTATTTHNSVLNLTADSEAVITDNGSVVTLTDNDDTNLSVPSGSAIADNGNGNFNVDVDNDGTVDAVIPKDVTLVNNGNGTLTTMTAGGAEVTTQANAGAVITDNGSVLTVNGDGQGVADISSVANDTDISIAANGDVTATTSNNSVLNLTADSEAVITDDGSIVTLTDNNGTNLNVPSGIVLTDNGNGSFSVDVDNDALYTKK
ncbi:beta strand repeat-containing protein, partial [Cysteiniphilum halobium]|uniref:beta strand repeat-containing protein n=1 Tax=Cysteiniphilum halobium TaxID=2219059 RepID=UPI0013C31476